MTTKSPRALLAAVLLAACATAALLATPASAAPSLSSSVQTHLSEAQKAATAKDFATATTAIKAAEDASKSDFDKYTTARVSIGIFYNSGDVNSAAKAAQDAVESPAQADAEKFGNLKLALQLTTQVKMYDKAVQDAKALDALPATAADLLAQGYIAQALYFGGDFADAKVASQKWVDAQVKAGKKPDRNSLLLLMSADASLKDEAGAEAVLETEINYYNDPQDWAQLIDVAFGTQGLRDVDAVWLGRLLFVTGAPVTSNTANMIGSVAGHLTFYGDAVNAKSHGGTVDPDPGPRADADKKTIASQITAADKANGTFSAKLAEALYSYGMYPEAEAQAKVAIAKGGNPDTSEGPMVLAQAQAAQGKYDDALATLATVTGGGPATAKVVKLWVDYVKLKKNPPVAAAPAAAAK